MKLERGLLVGAAMVALAIAGAGCKSSSDGASDPGQPGVQSPSNTATPAGGGDDPGARRARRHRGHGHGHGDWERKRRARANNPGSDGPDPGPQQPPLPQ